MTAINFSGDRTFIADMDILELGVAYIEIRGNYIRLGTDWFKVVERDTYRRGYWIQQNAEKKPPADGVGKSPADDEPIDPIGHARQDGATE